jgi:hypothetical protein
LDSRRILGTLDFMVMIYLKIAGAKNYIGSVSKDSI